MYRLFALQGAVKFCNEVGVCNIGYIRNGSAVSIVGVESVLIW